MTQDFSKLKGRMREMGYSQEKLAKEVGISSASLQNKLSGKSDFRLKEMKTISLLLKISPNDIFFA